MNAQKGDWVRFYAQGKLVIGVVEYISNDTIGDVTFSTTEGEVDSESVLEMRRKL